MTRRLDRRRGIDFVHPDRGDHFVEVTVFFGQSIIDQQAEISVARARPCLPDGQRYPSRPQVVPKNVTGNQASWKDEADLSPEVVRTGRTGGDPSHLFERCRARRPQPQPREHRALGRCPRTIHFKALPPRRAVLITSHPSRRRHLTLRAAWQRPTAIDRRAALSIREATLMNRSRAGQAQLRPRIRQHRTSASR